MGAYNGRTALVTGASKGIGLHIARFIAKEGAGVVLAACSVEKLEQVAADIASEFGVQATVVGADLASPDGVAKLVEDMGTRGLSVDILVNNAGMGTHGRFTEIGGAREDVMVRLNVLALTQLTHAVLPGMLERKWGRILNVASTASFQPTPLMTTYGATKAFVRSQSIGLREELKGTGVGVTCLCPGTTATDFFETAGVAEGLPLAIMRPEKVAEIAVDGLVRGRAVVVPGIVNKVLHAAAALAPATFSAYITEMIMRVRK